ncbi:tRNA (adenosine(37)-N6)-threonylcarbamoyltransferase complex ATPase subunit type 1 TsaE [Intestinibacillus massiliensis]|nr:tRNA (adenosine(37)-N6)-threonylcarbamoyltransferase complex ATPase subunit type 1 TsaE [Intestinibacillus massiliensis]
MEYCSHSAEETEQAGARYAATLSPGDVVTLDGDLGAGKTAFARGVLRGLGYGGRVTSPTFAIANEYETAAGDVAHFDMYRILDEEALWELGFEDYLDGARILLIEWSGNIAGALPARYKTVSIDYGAAPDSRIITTGEVGYENPEL